MPVTTLLKFRQAMTAPATPENIAPKRILRMLVLFVIMPAFIAFAACPLSSTLASDQPIVIHPSTKSFRQTHPDLWVGIDGLGRQVVPAPGTAQHPVPPARSGRFVGMFYFVWLTPQTRAEPFSIEEILQKPPHQREWGPVHAFHWWGKPRFGFYRSDDRWVMRQHAFLLNDLGVDVILIDVTNALTYDEQVQALFETWNELRQAGQKTPQIAFLANSHAQRTVQHLLEKWYLPQKFPELWFRWHEKPLLLMPLDEATPEMRQRFEIRHSWAWTKGQKWFGDGQYRWPWLDHTPQGYGWSTDPKKPEQISVSVAEHPVSNIGRSFSNGRQPAEQELKTVEGLHFREQWQRAHEVDPEFILITGWNEWIAQRFISPGGQPFLGRPTQKGETFFVDQFSAEFSRDIEPAAGPLADHYYYQTMAEIRRFKGTGVPFAASIPHQIIDPTSLADWQKPNVCYLDDLKDSPARSSASWVYGAPRIEQPAAACDLESSAVGFDGTNYWVQTKFRQQDEKSFVLELWLDLDGKFETGPCGFETMARIDTGNRNSGQTAFHQMENATPHAEQSTIERASEATKIIVSRDFAAIQLSTERIHRNSAGLAQFRWKWYSAPDHSSLDQSSESAIPGNHPFIAGDSAPNGRLGYLYREERIP
ncbi:hypothetical protein [Planctopirus hydrillae]|nr:hypothetical protein [Planctopirus hydrillae]